MRLAVEHLDSLLSLHVGARSLGDCLAVLAPAAPLWFVLRGPADDGLVLPVAWDTARGAHFAWADRDLTGEGRRGAVGCVAFPRVLACDA